MDDLDRLFAELEGFEWDAGNSEKNWLKHGVRREEAEQAVLASPLIAETQGRSLVERRYFALGRSDAVRLLAVVFTVRGRRLRIVSARPMNAKERGVYGRAEV